MESRLLPPERLLLDPDNPRIPLSAQGQDQEDLFLHLHQHGVLSELVDSFIDNGFFANEPLLVVRQDGAQDENGGPWIVIEGNRRLAALKWLLQIPPGDALSLDRSVPAGKLGLFESIPVVLIEDRSSVSTYLGFRHISGLKPWAPEAKARFIAEQVDRVAADSTSDNPFSQVGRAFGSNATGMRSSYLAYRILKHARDELKISVTHAMTERFGVWTRCLNSSDIRDYIGLGRPRTYDDVCTAILELDGNRLREVIGDLTPSDGKSPVLADSRDITHYGQVLSSPEARKVLRATGNLGTARMLVMDASLATRLDRLAVQAAAILREMIELDESHEDLEKAAENLFSSARKMRSLLLTLREEDE